jgi:hypothetical protein
LMLNSSLSRLLVITIKIFFSNQIIFMKNKI